MDNYKKREFIDPSRGYLYIALAEHEVKENMLGHEKWVEIPEGADCLMQWSTGHKVFYRDNFTKSWNNAYKEWHFVSGDDGIDQSSTLWKRTTQDPTLISGADVPRLIKEGNQIQLRAAIGFKLGEWKDLDLERDEEEFSLGDLINFRFEWRLKPQTIKVELELPKPFEPKLGDMYWFISPFYSTGYDSSVFEDHQADQLQVQYGAYRTQDEIKQVVKQLRKIRGTNS
ncbi:hypothetical protein NQ804_04270 [Acinetobacter baumannii]|nr:hypothetical protein [Acinetobacter baumannii]